MSCEHIEDIAHNESVIGIRCQALGHTQVEQTEHIVCLGIRIDSREVRLVGLDGEVVLFLKRIVSETFHAHRIAPRRTNGTHVLLQGLGNLDLSLIQLRENLGHICNTQQERISLIDRSLLQASLSFLDLDVSYSHTATVEMASCLLSVIEAVKAHDLSRCHLHRFAVVQLDRVKVVAPIVHLFGCVCLLAELLQFIGVECQLVPSVLKSFKDGFSCLSVTLECIDGKSIFPLKESSCTCSLTAVRLPSNQFKDGVSCCLRNTGKPSFCVELVDVVHRVADNSQDEVQVLQLLLVHQVHLICGRIEALHRSIDFVDVALDRIDKALRHIQIEV